MARLIALLFVSTAWTSASESQAATEELFGSALPDVDFFMEGAQDPLKEFGEQAEMLKKQVAENEEQKKASMLNMKAKFESNLTIQAERIDQIHQDIIQLNKSISQENLAVAKLRTDCKKVQKSNDVMRTALESLRPKMRTAAGFLADTIQMTDDRNSTDLDVLRPTTPKPTLEHFLDALDHSHKVSLLEVSAGSRRSEAFLPRSADNSEAGPEDLVGTLAERLEVLSAAGDQGEAKLKARFLAYYEVGSIKEQALLSRKQTLSGSLTEVKALHAQLDAVKTHLFEIRSLLYERIQAILLFAVNGEGVAATALDRAQKALAVEVH